MDDFYIFIKKHYENFIIGLFGALSLFIITEVVKNDITTGIFVGLFTVIILFFASAFFSYSLKNFSNYNFYYYLITTLLFIFSIFFFYIFFPK
jgi:hypothetical protein